MSKLQVIVRQQILSQTEIELIQRIISNLLKLEINDYEIVNVKYYRLNTTHSMYICFGAEVYTILKNFISPDKIVALPELDKLFDRPGNESSRQEVVNKLTNLYDYIHLQNTAQESLSKLPKLTVEQLSFLKDTVKKTDNTGFTLLNEDGKTFRIRLDKSDTVEADHILSIEEILCLRLVADIFDVKHLQITGDKK